MKKLIFLSVFILASVTLPAQSKTEEWLLKIPALPKDSCNITKTAAEEFRQNIADLIEQAEAAIDDLREVADQKSEGNEEIAKAHAMKQMSQQYGVSPEQMEKLKSGKMSAADKQAMADKIVQQQTNMSMSEVQKLSKMSEAGKKAYAEAYGTEMMATQQANPNKQTVSQDAKNMNQLVANQQAILGRINANSLKIGNLYASFENDPNLQKSYRNIEKWNEKLMSMTGIDYGQGKQMDSLAMLIQKEQIKICDQYTPRYHSALRQHLSILKASMPDYQQLGEITARITKLQTGVDIPAENIEVGNLQAIKGYLGNLKDAYKFKLYFPEEN